ncbi:MAG TPA: VTT domain-containing protein, partial [Pirellulales bacterium]|nr:VTT domain-containing protein [Pirellulales bacterium]
MIAACLLAAVVGLAALRWLPGKQYLNALAAEIQSWGIWGPVLLVVIYLVTTLLLLPAWVFTVLAGFLFGVVKGTLTASLASVTSAGVAFLLGRTVARDWVQRKLGHSPRFQAIDAAVESQGFKLVV